MTCEKWAAFKIPKFSGRRYLSRLRRSQSPSPHSPRGFATRLSALPRKLYFVCAYNTASYAGYSTSRILLALKIPYLKQIYGSTFQNLKPLPLLLTTGKINNLLSECAITILGKEKLVLFIYCKQFNVFVNRIPETHCPG